MDLSEHSIGTIFAEALEITDAEQRKAFLSRACGPNDSLRREVEELLATEASIGDSFLPKEPARPGVELLASCTPEALAQKSGTPAPVATNAKPGDRIGPYTLLEQIGDGGCGVVYLAEQQEPVRRRIALKIIKLGMDTRSVVARFEVERQALALMDHPNIAKVLDAGATNTGRPFFAMELVQGRRITEYCDQQERSIRERLELFIKVCQAVQHAHQKGIIHRDLKPSNVLVAQQDGQPVPKIIDFGIAKAMERRLTDLTFLTELHQFIGTPSYMSPEQAGMSGLDIDTRSDIYSLGALLYELLTGKTPLECKELLSADVEEMRRVLRQREPMRPSIRLRAMLASELTLASSRRGVDRSKLVGLVQGDLDWIVMKCLEKDRARRYDTAIGLASDIQRHLDNEPVVARPPSTLYRMHKLVGRNKLIFASAFAVGTALLIGLGLAVGEYLDKSHAYMRALAAESKERAAREDAQRAQANESVLRKQAQAAALRMAELVDQIEVKKAQEFFALGDAPGALATLAHVLRRNPSNQVAASRLLFALSQRSYALPRVNSLTHQHWVWAAHFSPDGRSLLTISSDQTARLWDTGTGLLVSTLPHHANVTSAQFSPNGQKVATASEEKLARIWDLNTGQTLELRHQGIVWFVRFSPDGRKLLTAAWDGTARIWDSQTGLELTPPLRHEKEVYCAFFSPDGQRIVTASVDGTARVWNARTGAALGPPLRHPAKVWYAQFSPDGLKVATACEDHTACVWNAETGEPITPPLPHEDAVLFVEFSPDNRFLATACADHRARIFDSRTGQLLATLPHESVVRSARFSPEGARLVTASDDGTARIWAVPSGRLLMEPLRHQAEIWYAEFSPDGRQVATASIDQTAQLWDLPKDEPSVPPLRQLSNIRSLEFSSDGHLLLTCCAEGIVQVWDAQSAQPLGAPFSNAEGISWAQFSPDGQSLLTLSQAHTVRVQPRDGRPAVTLPLAPSTLPLSARFTPDGAQIVTVSKPSDLDRQPSRPSLLVQLWESTTARELAEPFALEGTLSGLHVAKDRLWLLTLLPDGSARAWDVRNRRPLSDPIKCQNPISFAQFSPDAERILSLTSNDTIQVWTTRTGHALTESLPQPAHVSSAQFGPNGRQVLTVAEQTVSLGRNVRLLSTLRVWDAVTGELLAESSKHNGKVTAAQFASDGQRILTAIAGNGAWLWDSRSGEMITELLHKGTPLTLARLSADGQRLVCVSGERAWLTETESFPVPVPAWLAEFAEAVAGKRLNQHRALESVPTRLLLEQNQRIRASGDESFYTRWAQRFLDDRQLAGPGAK